MHSLITQEIPSARPVLSAAGVRDTRARDFLALLKPRVMSLVVFTGLAGMAAAPGPVQPVTEFIALLSMCLGAGGSAALNMALDSDIDALMTRTRARPIPAGRISRRQALLFG